MFGLQTKNARSRQQQGVTFIGLAPGHVSYALMIGNVSCPGYSAIAYDMMQSYKYE
jgi:hypothetical protein